MNLLTINQLEQGGIADATGKDTAMTTRVRTLYIPILPNVEYKVISQNPVIIRYIHFYQNNETKTYISSVPANVYNKTFTTPANAGLLRIAFQRSTPTLDITPTEAAIEGKVTLTFFVDDNIDDLKENINNININKQGQLINEQVLEGYTTAGFHKYGSIFSNEIIEY